VHLLKEEAKARGFDAVRVEADQQCEPEIEGRQLMSLTFFDADGETLALDYDEINDEEGKYDRELPEPGYVPVPENNWYHRLCEIDWRMDPHDTEYDMTWSLEQERGGQEMTDKM
jgi:hypothetical protein